MTPLMHRERPGNASLARSKGGINNPGWGRRLSPAQLLALERRSPSGHTGPGSRGLAGTVAEEDPLGYYLSQML